MTLSRMVYLAPALVGLLFVLAWELLVRAFDTPFYIVPSPVLVARTLVHDGPLLFGSLLVTLRITGDLLPTASNLRQVLSQHAMRPRLMNERRSNEGGVDMAYRLLLRDPDRINELQLALAQTQGLTNVAVFLHDDEAEI